MINNKILYILGTFFLYPYIESKGNSKKVMLYFEKKMAFIGYDIYFK